MRQHNEGDRTGLKDELRDALYRYYGGDPQPSGFIGRYWIGTYEDNPDVTPFDPIDGYPKIGFEQGDRQQGTLTSEVFRIGGGARMGPGSTDGGATESGGGEEAGGIISFLIGGGCDITKVYVELIVEGEASHFPETMKSLRQNTYARHGVHTTSNFYSALRATGSCKETMERVYWDVARFRLVLLYFLRCFLLSSRVCMFFYSPRLCYFLSSVALHHPCRYVRETMLNRQKL